MFQRFRKCTTVSEIQTDHMICHMTCRLKALKAVEKLVSLLSNQPEEVHCHDNYYYYN